MSALDIYQKNLNLSSSQYVSSLLQIILYKS